MIQVISMNKRRLINRYKDFTVVSPTQHKDLLDYIRKELVDPDNSIIELSKWEAGERQ